MNSTNVKETRSVGKAHKKAQRNRKQQQQLSKTQEGIEVKNGKCKNIKTTPAGPNNNNNNNNNNNSNSNIHHNNNGSNITEKFRAHLEAERLKKNSVEDNNNNNKNEDDIISEKPPIKFERAHSFSLKGRISKLFSSMTGSKENISRLAPQENEPAAELPFNFTRSRSMILIRRPNRRSFIEPQLEQLSEEVEKTGEPIKAPMPTELTEPSANKSNNIKPGTLRQNSVPIAEQEEYWLGRRGSTLSLAVANETKTTENPQLNFQRRRSNTLIASFRSTLAGLIGGSESEQQVQKKKMDKLNPKWSASLQSLQAIDNMVSYENMSFIDYDKLNGYEKHLEKQLSLLHLDERLQPPPPPPPPPPPAPATTASARVNVPSSTIQPPLAETLAKSHSTNVSLNGSNHSFTNTTKNNNDKNSTTNNNNGLTIPHADNSPALVIRRRHRSLSNQSFKEIGNGFNLDTDYEHNLDKFRNVYRDSLDSRKLEFLNDFMRNPNAADEHIVDVLNLEVLRRPIKRRASICSASLSTGEDRVDSHVPQIKSKSLTHLDRLDPAFIYSQQNHRCSDIDDNYDDKQRLIGPVPLLQNNVFVANTTTASIISAPSSGILYHTDSGTEYFQISFCLDPNATEDYELIPVKKGMKLSNALNSTLKKRNLSFSKIHILDNTGTDFLDTDITVQSLDKNTSVEGLTGHHLIVTQRDSFRKTTLQKAASFGARSRPARLLSSASTEETSEPVPSTSTGSGTAGSASVGKVKQRWSGLFGVKNAQYVQLCEILNAFSRTGVPQQPETILYLDHPNFADAMQYLSNMHTSWTDFVDCENMNDNDKRIQTAIWELVTTEVFYIQTLQTVTNLFLACLLAVQDQHILNEIDQNKLFSNVREICFANLRFWTMSLYPMVAHSVATREPMRIVFFQQGFASFGTLFAPYKRYCAEQSTCQYYCKELYRSNVLFTSYLAWCESHKMCNRLRLADILVRPMQRLTKYSLLLSAIRKQLYNMQDVELLDYMIQSVENFVCSVNSHLTIRQEHERLKGVMARIESYDVVPETNNEQLDRMLRQFSRMFDLCMPMKGCPAHHVRHLFMEGDHKYKDHLGKIDVHCFLMTDMLIVCKAMSKKSVGQLKVIRQPYITDRLFVHLQNNVLCCVYLNEYQVAVTAFTLTSLEARSWYDSLKRARNVYTRLKQSVLNLTATGGPNMGATSANASTAGGGSFMSDFTPYTNAFASNFTGTYSGSNVAMTTDGIHASSGNFDSNLAVTTSDPLSMIMRKSPMSSSSVCSRISSTNASKSGSVEWNESRNISVEMEKTNSLSSDDGATALTSATGTHGVMAALIKGKNLLTGHKNKLALSTTTNTATSATTSSNANRLCVQQPFISHLGQSLPNLTTHQSQTSSSSNLYHTYSNNTLLVPSTTSTHSGNLLLSPSHRGISYPPPSPTRVPLRRGLAFSTSTKNPPLVKTRNITSQNSFSWRQMFSPNVVSIPQTNSMITTTTPTTATTIAASPPRNQQSEHFHNFPLSLNIGGSLDTHMAYATSGLTADTTAGAAVAAPLTTQSMSTQMTPLLLTTDDIAEETAEHLMQY